MADACLSLDLLEKLVREGTLGGPAGCPDGAAAEEHLRGCSHCRTRLAEMREVDAFIAGVSQRTPRGSHGSFGSRHHDPRSPSVRDDFPGYAVEAIVDIGGQGAIYRARQLATGRVVAIKVPLGDAVRQPARRYRFRREIELTSRLDHPGIVRVFGVCEAPDGRIGCVMEFVEGRRFDEWAEACRGSGKGGNKDGVQRIVTAAARVAEAIAYAHQRGVLHRDLKPSNVLVTDEGLPRVLDFGLAKALDGGSGSFVTMTGAFLGTLAYAAPEQVDGRSDKTDIRTDVYGIGLVLYQALAGRVPWDAEAAAPELCAQIRRGEAPRPSPLGGAPDAELDAIVLKAIATDMDRRYASAALLAEDLDRWLTGRPVRARFDSTWYVIRKTAGRHKALLAGALLVALAIVAGASVAGYGLLHARDARAYEAVERARSETEAQAARSAGRIIQQMFESADAALDDAALGGHVRAGRMRVLSNVRLGVLFEDPDAEAAAQAVFASEVLKLHGLADGEVLVRMAIASLYKKFGDNHPALADAFHDLADILLRRGSREVEAERAVRRAIEIRGALFRDGDPALAASRHLLARILLARGDSAGAELECERALVVLRLAGKPSAPELAAALATRSDIHHMLGRAAEAESDALESLILGLETVLDDDDPILIECLLRNAALLRVESPQPPHPTLAAALQAPGRMDVAEVLSLAAHALRARGGAVADCLKHAEGLETVLALRVALFGKDHPSVIRTLSLIVADHATALDYAGVEASLLRLLPLMENRVGRNHLGTIQTREMLFEFFMCRENYAGAAMVRGEMIEVWNAQPEGVRDDLWMANEHRWRAFALALSGEFTEAEVEYRASIDGLARAGLSDHYLGDICNGALGWVALHLERPDEAELLTRGAIDRLSARVGVPPDQLALLKRHRAHVLIARGQLDEAAPLLDSALATIMTPTSRETWLIAFILLDAIELARQKGDHAAVERLTSDLAAARRRAGVPPG